MIDVAGENGVVERIRDRGGHRIDRVGATFAASAPVRPFEEPSGPRGGVLVEFDDRVHPEGVPALADGHRAVGTTAAVWTAHPGHDVVNGTERTRRPRINGMISR